MRSQYLITLLFISTVLHAGAQTDSLAENALSLPENYIADVSAKIVAVDKKLSKQTLKALKKFEKLEARVAKTLKDNDSTRSDYKYSTERLEQFKNEFTSVPDKAIGQLNGEYNAYTDTLSTAFKFLQQKNKALNSKQFLDKLSTATSKLNLLQGRLSKAEAIKKYFSDRREALQQQLKKAGLFKELKMLEKTTYYYTAHVKEYKDMLKDRKKIERKAMALLYSMPAFKKFISENSLLAGLFKLPGAESSGHAPVLAGIQTRASVQQLMQECISTGGPNAVQIVRKQVQDAQAELEKLKDKIMMYGSAEAELPHFKPNDQKTKTFLQRLEYGVNIQFGRSNYFLPATSDIAFSLGYKLNTNGVVGFGASYKIGLGSGWNNIKLSNEGLGLRSYADWKLRGRFFISGGYEQNYNSSFKNIQQLKKYSAWQSSGLIGLSKKLKLKGSKMVKLQVLYDFLSYKHVPVTQPFIFRTGISFK